MESTPVIGAIRKTIDMTCRIVNGVAALMLFGMMLIIVVDVILRYVFKSPLAGGPEFVEFMLAVTISLSLAYAGVRKAHVAVGFLVSRFSQKVQVVINSINQFLAAGFFFLIAWKSAGQAVVLKANEQTSMVMSIPIYPFLWVLVIGSGLLGLVFIIQCIQTCIGESE